MTICRAERNSPFFIPIFFLLVCHHGHTVIRPPWSRVFWHFQNSLVFSLLEKLVGRGRLKFKRGFNWTWEPCCKQIPLHFVPNRHHCFFSSNHRHFKPYGPSLEVESESVCLSLGVRLTPPRSWYHGNPTCVTESITVSSFFLMT